ncbi:ubiquinol oxidase subunit II [Gammaproteobacteria bacterium]|nr:ubiquinol oxidase subunit II [Gammaproteobacteria bacterium]
MKTGIKSKLINLVKSLAKLLVIFSIVAVVASLTGCKELMLGILNPKGIVALEERKLFFDTLALMLIVVIPVIIMSFAFIYHYRASNNNRDYKPNWSHSFFLEAIWWAIPCVIIVVLAVMTWNKTHELDPYAQIKGYDKKPMVVQVIALPWKWLFIYPEQGIATVNYLQIPVNKQVEYQITADNVAMSAFFIPQLGSQIYAMGGMRTKLHLVANHEGEFDGLNTQYNGHGFSEMHFLVKAVTDKDMQKWIKKIKFSSKPLTESTYSNLLLPSTANKPQYFSGVDSKLFENVILTYMHTFGNVHPNQKRA